MTAEQTVRGTCVHRDGYEHPAITKDGGQSWSTCDHAVLDSLVARRTAVSPMTAEETVAHPHDVAQVRELIDRIFRDHIHEGSGRFVGATGPTDHVMAVVTPILAARDAAVERAEQRLSETEDSWEQLSGEYHAADERAERAEMFEIETGKRWKRAEADLAAARQQLDQVRVIAGGSILIPPVALRRILDAAPADETGGA